VALAESLGLEVGFGVRVRVRVESEVSLKKTQSNLMWKPP
jgi:hypothetical protein